MCGIAGFVGLGDKSVLKSMCDLIAHRGPDDEGLHADTERGVYLGHRRLSIIDLEGGHQPMWTRDQELGVVFNGEIYNHRRLREELIAQGHVFESDHSDTEVLLHGYRQWGNDLPSKLDGMFAFILYDRNKRELYAARDRFGEKPFYYLHREGLFAFASELRALAAHPQIQLEMDPQSLKKYLAYGFLPAPHSVARGVRKLPAGHMLRYGVTDGSLKVQQYWEFRIEPQRSKITPNAAEELAAETARLLEEAVRSRMVSDVPIGVFLSGGIDSTAVLAFAKRASSLPVKTFSIGFTDPSFDESEHARVAARHFGSEHFEKVFDDQVYERTLAEVLGRSDEPWGDPSILPTYLVSQFAAEQVKVVLGGDGGDELFAGYDPFRALRYAELYQRIVPPPVHRLFRRFGELLPVSERNISLDFKIKRTLRGLTYDRAHWNPVWLAALEPVDLARLFSEKTDPEELYAESLQCWNSCQSESLVDRSLEFYTRFYLQDSILTKVDRASMMNSLEVRAPFLAADLVDFVRKVPWQYKLSGGRTKALLKDALVGIVPDEILTRKKKGFGVPMTRLMRSHFNASMIDKIPRMNQDWIRQRWSEHGAGKADHRQLLWFLMGFNAFFNERIRA